MVSEEIILTGKKINVLKVFFYSGEKRSGAHGYK